MRKHKETHRHTNTHTKTREMSWCTAAEVAELINVARLRADVDAATRKAADLRFIDICTGAINAGDVLMQIATAQTATAGLRLNAVFAAQPLITKEGWCEGGQFSDRSAVTHRLLELTADPSFSTDAKISAELLRSLAMIAALEFPSEDWQRWLQACAYAFVSGSLTDAAKVRAVVAESYRNYLLWRFLASDLTAFLLQAQLGALPQRTIVLRIFLELMRKRPRPSAEHEIASPSNCVLLSADMRHFVMASLAARVGDAGQSATLSAGFVEDCTAAFAVASRLVVDSESAMNVFRCSSFFLARLQDTAARGEMSDELSAFAEQLLECLLSTLQLFPEVASSDIEAGGLLACLIHFMIEPEQAERNDAAQLATELLDFFLDDEAIPLGCGSGDVAHLAGAVLELYLEHNPAQRTSAIATLNGILASTPHMSGVLADAVALALRSVSRVYEAAEAVVVDALDATTQAALLTQVSQLLLCTVDPHAHVMLIDALTHCFYRSRNESLCRQLVELLQQLHTAAAARVAEAQATDVSAAGCWTCVRCACIYEAGRLVEEQRAQPWSASLLSGKWVELVVEQLASDDTFGVFCAASTLCTLLCVSPDSAQFLCANSAAWERGLVQLCRHATLRGMAALLTLSLKHISGVSTVAPSSVHQCKLVVSSCSVVLQVCQQPSPSRHLVLRSVVDFVAAHTRVCLRGGGCATCAQHLAGITTPLLTEPFATELLQEEASCRGFVTAATLRFVAFSGHDPAMASAVCGALVHALQHAVQHLFSSQTISSVAGHLALVVTLQPSLADEASTHVLQTLFASDVDLVTNRKGLNYGGVAFFLSLVFLRHPHTLLHAASITGSESGSELALAIQRAFGWWLSLAPFVDATHFPYFAAACCRVTDVVAAATANGSVSNLSVCRHFIIPSLYAKKLPPRPFTKLTVHAFLALAWSDLERRYSGTSKPQVFDKELQPCVAGVEQHYAGLCSESFQASTAAALLKTTAADTIAAVLSYLSRHDGGEDVRAARQRLQDFQR